MESKKETDQKKALEVLMALQERVKVVSESMPEIHRKALWLRFGLEDGRCHTFEDVEKELGLSRERIRQLEAKLLTGRHPSRSRKLSEYLKE